MTKPLLPMNLGSEAEPPGAGRVNRKLKSGAAMHVGVPKAGATVLLLVMGTVFFFAGGGISSAFFLARGAGQSHSSNHPELATAFGGVFAVAGLLMVVMAFLGHRKRQAWKRMAAAHPDSPAMQDYPWPTEGSVVPRWDGFLYAFFLTLFLTVFIGVFTMAIQTAKDVPLFAPIILWVFWGAVALSWVEAIRRLLRAIRFQPGVLRWNPFPGIPGERFVLTWTSGVGIESWSGGKMSLRCCEQVIERRGSGKNRSSSVRHYVLWEDSRALEPGVAGSLTTELPFVFELPPDCPGSSLSGNEPTFFWEFEIELETSGVNPHEVHMVPIYSPSLPQNPLAANPPLGDT
jgi:hypothetical protein